MSALLWIGVASATGLARGYVGLVDAECAPVGADALASWPADEPLRVSGRMDTYTSPPGGPVNHQTYVASVDGVVVKRPDCVAPEPVQWVNDGLCGDDPAVRTDGPLQPGQTYAVGLLGMEQAVTVAGELAPAECPWAPMNRTELVEDRSRTVELPPDAFRYDADVSTIWVDPVAFGQATPFTGLTPEQLSIPLYNPIDPDTLGVVELAEQRWIHTSDTQVDGASVCVVQDVWLVDVRVQGAAGMVNVRWLDPAARTETPGICPVD